MVYHKVMRSVKTQIAAFVNHSLIKVTLHVNTLDDSLISTSTVLALRLCLLPGRLQHHHRACLEVHAAMGPRTMWVACPVCL